MTPVDVAVYLATEPVDLRAGFDKLAALVRATLKMDPNSGALYLFTNRRKNRMKALWWDKNGWVILYKKLCRSSFHWRASREDGSVYVEISAADFARLLAGLPAANLTFQRPPVVH